MSCASCITGIFKIATGIAKPRKDGKIKFGYWGIRGLGAPFRMLLTYAGAEYEDCQYTDPQKWFGKDKPEVAAQNSFANLPYLVDGDVTVCQTNAIFEYLGDRFGLDGATIEEKRLNRQVLCEIYDLRNTIIELVYSFKERCRTKEEFETKMKAHLTEGHKGEYTKLEKCIEKSGGPYMCGRNMLTADFHVFEMLDQHEVYAKAYGAASPLAGYPKLAALHAAVKASPKLAPYFASDAYKLPCNAGVSWTSGTC